MAKPPKCKLCGEAHWSGEAHRFDAIPSDVSPLKPPTKAALTAHDRTVAELRTKIAELESRDAERRRKAAERVRLHRAKSA